MSAHKISKSRRDLRSAEVLPYGDFLQFAQSFRNEVKRSMLSRNFEIFLIIKFWSTFIYSLLNLYSFLVDSTFECRRKLGQHRTKLVRCCLKKEQKCNSFRIYTIRSEINTKSVFYVIISTENKRGVSKGTGAQSRATPLQEIFRDPPNAAHSTPLRYTASGSRGKFPAWAMCFLSVAFIPQLLNCSELIQ